MPREAEPSQNEKAFVLKLLEDEERLDGRSFTDYRTLELTFGDEHGVAEVNLGKTRVLVKVSAEVTVPHSDRPFEGTFTITSELSPMVSPAQEPNRPPTEQEVLLSRLLEKTIRRSGALDAESLCLAAGKKCWALRADVHVLQHDGNVVDSACLAVVAALRHFRRPDASVSGDGEVVVYTAAEREPVPLSWLHSPLCVTFAFFEIFPDNKAEDEGGADGAGEVVALVDASWLEEQVRSASCTIGLNKHGEICQVSKMGGIPVDAVMVLRCATAAVEKVREFTQLLDDKLAQDAKNRDIGGLIAELRAENDRES